MFIVYTKFFKNLGKSPGADGVALN